MFSTHKYSKGDIVYATVGRHLGNHTNIDVSSINSVVTIHSVSFLPDPRDNTNCYWVIRPEEDKLMHVSEQDITILYSI